MKTKSIVVVMFLFGLFSANFAGAASSIPIQGYGGSGYYNVGNLTIYEDLELNVAYDFQNLTLSWTSFDLMVEVNDLGTLRNFVYSVGDNEGGWSGTFHLNSAGNGSISVFPSPQIGFDHPNSAAVGSLNSEWISAVMQNSPATTGRIYCYTNWYGWDYTVFGTTMRLDWDNGTYNSPVPVPGAIFLLGSGLIGLVGISRRRQQL